MEREEPLKLSEALEHMLEECRMVLPGIQAVFGFQLIAFFNQGFQRLDPLAKHVHLIALLCVAISAALTMTPAALHRLVSPLTVTDRLVDVSGVLLKWSLVPLATGLCMDVAIVARMVLGGKAGAAVGIGLLAVYALCWLVLPRREQARRERRRTGRHER